MLITYYTYGNYIVVDGSTTLVLYCDRLRLETTTISTTSTVCSTDKEGGAITMQHFRDASACSISDDDLPELDNEVRVDFIFVVLLTQCIPSCFTH